MTIMKVKQQDGTIVNVPLGGQTIVDQTYSATSTNAQSGIAVAQAIEQALGEISSALEELHSYATSLAGGGSQ